MLGVDGEELAAELVADLGEAVELAWGVAGRLVRVGEGGIVVSTHADRGVFGHVGVNDLSDFWTVLVVVNAV